MTKTLTKDIERRILTSAAKSPGLKLRKRGEKRDDETPPDPAAKGDDKPDQKDDKTPGTIEGYAAVFYDEKDEGTEYKLWDDPSFIAIERIARGAFGRAIK